MQNDENRGAKRDGQGGQELRQRLDAAGRAADDDAVDTGTQCFRCDHDKSRFW